MMKMTVIHLGILLVLAVQYGSMEVMKTEIPLDEIPNTWERQLKSRWWNTFPRLEDFKIRFPNENAVRYFFHTSRIVPDVIPRHPEMILKAQYGRHQINLGNRLQFLSLRKKRSPAKYIRQPPTLSWKTEPEALYTVILTDPDSPKSAAPTNREFRHWLVVNVPGNDVSSGKTLTTYLSPHVGLHYSGPHRIVLLVYKQNGLIDDVIDNHNRAHWKTAKFAHKHRLGDPVAGNFFLGQKVLV